MRPSPSVAPRPWHRMRPRKPHVPGNAAPLKYAFRDRKAVEAVLHLLGRLPAGTSPRLAARALYRAEREHLLGWGRPVFCDTYVAMPCGAEPVMVGALLRGDAASWPDPGAVRAAFCLEAAPDGLPKALREANLDFLSQTDRECLDEAAAHCLERGYRAAEVTQRDRAWRAAAPLGPIDWGAMLDPSEPGHAEAMGDLRMYAVYGLV